MWPGERRRQLTAGAVAVLIAAASAAVSALANFVSPMIAAVLGLAAGGLAGAGTLWWEERRERDDARRTWEAAVTTGPASGVDGATATSSLLAAVNPDQQVVPFSPLRGADVRALVHWCRSSDSRRVWRVAGDAGTGKTRLLLQAAHTLTEEGWRCGWVRRGKAADAVAAAALRGGSGPVLLVVDDADTQPDPGDLAAMLSAVANEPPEVRLRVVLAARDFGGWWGGLRERMDPAAHAGLKPPGSTHLTPMGSDVPGQQQLFQRAVNHYADHFGGAPPAVTLTGITNATPIAELHAAAASVAFHGLSGSVPISLALSRLFQSEETWWQSDAANWNVTFPLPVLQAAIAAAALIGADDKAQFVRRLRCLPGLASSPDERLSELALWLHQLYAQRGGEWLDPHLPARLAERYIASCVASQPSLPSALASAALLT